MTRRTLLAITELFVIVMMTSRGIAQTPTLSVCVSNLKRSLSLTMYFGNDNRATYGIDKSLGEIEGPPFGPSLDVRWLSRRKDISYGFGLLRNDFVPCPTNEERKDTFILLISQPDKKPTTWILEWKRDELRAWADSMFLVVRSDTTMKVNMLKSDSARISSEEGVQRVNIYKYGGCATQKTIKQNSKGR